jgi:hypothetical protein
MQRGDERLLRQILGHLQLSEAEVRGQHSEHLAVLLPEQMID